MKNVLYVGLIVLGTLSMSSCGGETKTEAAADSTATAVDSTAEVATDAIDSTANSASAAVDSTAEAAKDSIKH